MGRGILTSMDINEKALLYRAQTGDRRAAEVLYERYYLEMFTYLFYRVNDKATAEQYCSEVFRRMIRDLPKFTNHKITFSNWLYKIARDLVKENGKAFQPELITESMLDPEAPSASECFKLAIRHLDEQEKAIIVHRLVEGRSIKDIVEITKKSEKEVRSLQRRALSALHDALESEGCI